ncbi:MAG: hypothetical protein RLZZ584_1741 [Pseudomonadota bacterium]|jgi:multiple sugar transport system substrate-binding protein
MRRLTKHLLDRACSVGLLAITLTLGLSACQRGGDAPAGPVVVRHLLWDSAQRPAYQQCASAFERQHPDVRIRIVQQGWDDYWSTLSTGFVAGTAPDVFTNHLTKFAEQVVNGVLLDIAPLMQRDGVDAATLYEPGLAANWARGAEQYGLPADWDTIALVVNLDHAMRAGVSLDELRQMHWNPADGGSYAQVIARLTRDQAGRSALDAGFDRQHVAVWGYQNPGLGGMFGQSEWSHYAWGNGFRFQDAPWAVPLHYDAPALAQTVTWLAGLPAKGWSAAPEALGSMGADALFAAGRVAMVPTGSWMVGHTTRSVRFAHTFVPLPVGPDGRRWSMRNGLAHSIWSGSPRREQAWAWLRYLGSAECQAQVATHGVVYPAVRGLGEVAAQAQRAQGAEPGAFLDAARGATFAPPVVDRSAQINDLIAGAIEQALLGRAPAAEALAGANTRANALLRP